MSDETTSVLDESEDKQESKPIPPELTPKKGKGPCPECGSLRRHKSGCTHAGEGSKPKQPAFTVNDDTLMNAFLGLWVAIGIVVWLIGGWFIKPDQNIKLNELSEKEAKDHAQLLKPLFMKFPMLFTVIAWIGAPIAFIKLIKNKIEITHKEKKEKKDAALRPVPEAG